MIQLNRKQDKGIYMSKVYIGIFKSRIHDIGHRIYDTGGYGFWDTGGYMRQG